MKVIKKLVLKNLKLNKKRSIGTIVGIMLSVALICAVVGMFTSLRETIIKFEKENNGDYHFFYANVPTEKLEILKHNRDIEKLVITSNAVAVINNIQILHINSVEDIKHTGIPVSIGEGRFPEKENEIAFDSMTMYELGLKLGDKLSLDIGNSIKMYGGAASSNKETETDEYMQVTEESEYEEYRIEVENPEVREFTVVGTIEGDDIYSGYTVGSKLGINNAYIRFNNPKNYEKCITDILGHTVDEENGDGLEIRGYLSYVNSSLLRWENMEFSDDTNRAMMYAIIILIVIILITSIFCIKNSFDISVTEKMKTYGMLASIGTTKKQIRRGVFYEGMYLGLVGIPLGIALGELAVFVLCKVVGILITQMAESNVDFDMVFYTPVTPILLAIVLGGVTIYFSAFFAAYKASRVSPIDNIRSNNEIQIKGNKLKVPFFISKVFGIGGVIAYKNLKRSRRKYRTTIISLSVSVFVFIAMSSFMSEMYRQTVGEYTEYDYNLSSYVSLADYKNGFRIPENISKKTNAVYYVYDNYEMFAFPNDNKVNYYKDSKDDVYMKEYVTGHQEFVTCVMEDETYKAYLKKLGIDNSDTSSCVLIDTLIYRSTDTNKLKKVRRTSYSAGDVINVESENNYSFKICKITDKAPYGKEQQAGFDMPIIVVSDKYFASLATIGDVHILLDAKDASETQTELLNLKEIDRVHNISDQVRANRAMVLLMGIFMYGFILVITLIGVTNIFNTITSNMELRQKEFAMLKSIGMTKREFGRMVNLETLFYSIKALLIGIIAGLIGSRLIYRAFAERIQDVYLLPMKPIIISIVFVFVLVYIIMKYSISRINKQNTIETIRRDTV